MADYPDYTRAMQIIGTSVTLPISIITSAITLSVDVVAWNVGTLSVDIAAQSVGNIAIDLAAQSVGNITVNIAAQSLTNLNINLSAQTVAIMYGGEWGASQGGGKSVGVGVTSTYYGQATYADYTVTTGKTLYIYSLSFYSYAAAAANADLPQIGAIWLQNYTDSIILPTLGGNGGGGITFPSPIRFNSGKVVRLNIGAFANHPMTMYAIWAGWEM